MDRELPLNEARQRQSDLRKLIVAEIEPSPASQDHEENVRLVQSVHAKYSGDMNDLSEKILRLTPNDELLEKVKIGKEVERAGSENTTLAATAKLFEMRIAESELLRRQQEDIQPAHSVRRTSPTQVIVALLALVVAVVAYKLIN